MLHHPDPHAASSPHNYKCFLPLSIVLFHRKRVLRMNFILSICLLLCVFQCSFISLCGAKSSKKEDDAFLKEFQKFMKDPKALQDTYAQLKNPESLQQVQAMMKDPGFLSEVNRLKSNPLYKDALTSVKEMYNDPAKAAKFLSAMSAARREEMSTAQLGMSELSKVAKNPKLMAEALEVMQCNKSKSTVFDYI